MGENEYPQNAFDFSNGSSILDEDVTNPAKESFKSTQKTLGLKAHKVSPLDDSASSGTSAEKVSNDVIVRYLDVDQGDSALITVNGKHPLIDGGPPGASSKLYSLLQQLDITELEYIIATHPDADHIGGISGMLNFSTCKTHFCSTASSDTKSFLSMTRYLEERGGVLLVPEQGQNLGLGGATLTFLGPIRHYSDDNNNSLVVRLDYLSTSFLFTGDAELEEEFDLYSAGYNIDTDVLKLAHHGSNSSTSTTFIDMVSPSLAVISVGENNYGHPDNYVLQSLVARDIPLLRADLNGDITITSDGYNLRYEVAKGMVS